MILNLPRTRAVIEKSKPHAHLINMMPLTYLTSQSINADKCLKVHRFTSDTTKSHD